MRRFIGLSISVRLYNEIITSEEPKNHLVTKILYVIEQFNLQKNLMSCICSASFVYEEIFVRSYIA